MQREGEGLWGGGGSGGRGFRGRGIYGGSRKEVRVEEERRYRGKGVG